MSSGAAGPLLLEERRWFHAHPSLSGEEGPVAAQIAHLLAEAGIRARLVLDGRGVIAELEGGMPGPRVMYRADIDALPVTEEGSWEWRSVEEGRMHACGHDCHIAIALELARRLAAQRPWPGAVRFCFQPGEETASGALPMIEAGVLEQVDYALGVHVWSLLQACHIGVAPGPLFGSADEFSITLLGRGGHGGMPHLSVDPVPVAALLIVALQGLISRETSPLGVGVITIGKIQGGSANNVIADAVELAGTVRAITPGDRERLVGRVEEVARAIAATYGATAHFERKHGTPPVVSDNAVTQVVEEVASAIPGVTVERVPPVTVADDMACYLEKVPGCYFLVGVGPEDLATAVPHHSARFFVNEDGLLPGVAVVEAAVRRLLEQGTR